MKRGKMKKMLIKPVFLFFLLMVALNLQAQTFTAYALRDTSGTLLNPTIGDDYDLLADGNGDLHILWSEGGYVFYGRVVYNAASGQYRVSGKENTNVNFFADDVNVWFTQPRAAVRRDGQTFHFVWGHTLRHAWRSAAGVWSKEIVRTVSGVQKCRAPSVVVEDNETVHVLYGYYDGSNGDDPHHLIYQRKPAGGSWSGYMEIDVDGYNAGAEWRNPVMTLDSQGGIHATWSNQIYWTTAYGGRARYRYAPAGSGLETATTVILPDITGVVMQGVGNIFVDPFGKVHRTICTSLGTVDHTSKPSGGSGSWSYPTRASIGVMQSPEDTWASLTTDSCGRVLVAFPDGTSMSDYPYIYVSVLNSGVWTKSTISTTAGGHFFRQPSIVSAAGLVFLLWRENTGQLYLATAPDSCGSLTLTSPNGGEVWTVGEGRDITWSWAGQVGLVNIDYSTDNGTSWSSVAANTANDGLFGWTVPNTPSTSCLVRVREVDGSPTDLSNSVFTIAAIPTETVSTPNTPSGPASGSVATGYSYSTGGSTSSSGHTVQYKFDWNDGSDSGWLAVGTTTASHSWSSAGIYNVRAMARCATHTTIESSWSTTYAVTISGGGGTVYYNSPAQRLILPEVNWAAASGGGNWVSEVQITDVSGGSVVQVYYNSGTNRRGPFTLWSNGSGAAGSSLTWSNVLQTIDNLDAGVFTYYGTGGSLEMITQDGSHKIQAAIRTYNGNYTRTFPALADVDSNTAVSGRPLLVPNMSMDTTFRPSLVLFNPSSSSVTANVQILGSNGSQIGSTITKTVAGYEMAGVDGLRNNTYSNADIWVTVTGGSGRLIVSGQSANNVSNDPAAHLAVQTTAGFATSPSRRLISPEVNWAAASGGGDWVSELHITDLSGGAVVQVYYNSGTNRRGPFTLWTNAGGANCSVTFSNVLQTIDGLDAGAFTYYGTGGALELVTQDSSHLIQAALRSYNGNTTRTFPALQDVEANTAASGRSLLIPNLSMDTTYRPSVALFNPTVDNVTVDVRIIGSNGTQIGSTITRALAGYEMAGVVGLRDYTYSNAGIRITVTSGSGRVIASGQSANNTSNDPAAHIPVQAY